LPQPIRRRPYAPRLPPPARREQLLDAALTVIDERGYRGLSIDAIARRADVSRPVVYDAFGGLTALMTALLAREEQRAFDALGNVLPLPPPPGTEPADILADGLANFARVVAEDPRPWRLMLLTPEGTPEDVRQHVEAGRSTVAAWLEALVRWAAETLHIEDIDAELVAHAVFGVGEQVARLSIADPERYSPERIRSMGQSFGAMLLAGHVHRVSVAPDGSTPREHKDSA
jgi:AcrR family transcriptional regulator